MPDRTPCWGDLDGYTKVDLASEKLLKIYFDCDILDPDDEPPANIVDKGDEFKVRFRLALVGDLWTCICGDWWFDVGYTPIGAGKNFDLSDLVGRDKFYVRNWKGCESRCVELVVTVPPNTIPVDYCGTFYEVAARFQLFCCDRYPVSVVGYEELPDHYYFRTTQEDE
jgi:hypothetical protein